MENRFELSLTSQQVLVLQNGNGGNKSTGASDVIANS